MNRLVAAAALALILVTVPACKKEAPPVAETPSPTGAKLLDESAESYVRLVLALGEHDEGYVDAYYGPAEWQEAVREHTPELSALREEASLLVDQLMNVDTGDLEEIFEARRRFLLRQTEAVLARITLLEGHTMTFDEESRALYDAVAPEHGTEFFAERLASLDELLPGEGDVSTRWNSFRDQFAIPADKLDDVFRRAIEECKQRTAAHLELPAGENFALEYVTDKAWSGYNWYQGEYQSLIQVNTDFPIYIDRAVDLACHEGYPGHHVYNMLLEKNLVRDRGWVENMVYPLYSPQSLIAEGSANYGIRMAFPGEERIAFEAEVLFPIAGLDAAKAELYYQILEVTESLSYAGNEAARQYLDGKIDAQAAAEWLSRYALMKPDRAAQRVRFIDTYRAYVINYNLGQDLVAAHVEALAGDDNEEAWKVFGELLSTPQLPSRLAGGSVH
ncbi:MAG: hypothetical protein K8J08_08260 [Thermoanaerobaculia bacterium]|nr:hypothetical protein [Thermoanaerobaculia bacterium]